MFLKTIFRHSHFDINQGGSTTNSWRIGCVMNQCCMTKPAKSWIESWLNLDVKREISWIYIYIIIFIHLGNTFLFSLWLLERFHLFSYHSNILGLFMAATASGFVASRVTSSWSRSGRDIMVRLKWFHHFGTFSVCVVFFLRCSSGFLGKIIGWPIFPQFIVLNMYIYICVYTYLWPAAINPCPLLAQQRQQKITPGSRWIITRVSSRWVRLLTSISYILNMNH